MSEGAERRKCVRMKKKKEKIEPLVRRTCR